MTLTESPAVSVPPSPASPSSPTMALPSDTNLIPRIVSFSDDSLLHVPLDALLVERLSLLPPPENCGVIDTSVPKKTGFSATPFSDDDEHQLEIHAKSKRSLLASNDLIYERDRFRARFESFNPVNSAFSISEENHDDDCEVCSNMLTKTKRVNIMASESISSSVSTDSVLERLYNYSIQESVSPLDSSSLFFKTHFPKLGTDSAEAYLNLRRILQSQLAAVFEWYFNRPLPCTSHMFPWLHGLHKDNFTQRSFFIQQKIQAGQSMDFDVDVARPHSARFLMCVDSSDTGFHHKNRSGKVLRNTVIMDEILQRIEYSRSEVMTRVRKLVFNAFPPEKYKLRDIAELTDMVVRDCFATGHMPVLLNLDPDRGVSLRNFHIQVAKLAKCLDFVVYCSEKDSLLCRCQSVARLLKLAQMNDGAGDFNVFLLGCTNIEKYPEMLALRDTSPTLSGLEASKKTQLSLSNMVETNVDTFSAWDLDFQVKEKIETTCMSAATRLHNNVWLGNIWDYQIATHYWQSQNGDADVDFDTQITPPVSSGHIYCDPNNSSLTREAAIGDCIVSFLPPPRAHWKLFIQCHNDARFPDVNVLSDLLFKFTITSHKASDVDDIVNLEFPSSGSIGFGDCKQANLMSIVNTCKLLYLYSSSVAEGSIASLIYSSDGYTELSLLLFCYIIYAENITLEDAMLRLHMDYGRPFYIFGTDVLVLRKLEILLRKFSPVVLGNNINWAKAETTSSQEINEILLCPPKAVLTKGIPNKLRLGYIADDSSLDTSDSCDSDDSDDINDTSTFLNTNWVDDVEGSFPSRILPYLYLGSLKHANNLTLLSKLGIKKVISVGEELDWLSGYRFQHNHDIIVDELDNGNIEIFNISPKPTSYNKHNSRCTVESVVKVNNLQDDGIDELSTSLPQVLAQIDAEYRRTNGNTKILVHCRVGVSRSATVVIAEVMRRLGLNLPQAYLYVRVRRLNIVIQPNLRFMYELFKWEEKERTKGQNKDKCLREIDWFVMCREIKKLNLPFLQN